MRTDTRTMAYMRKMNVPEDIISEMIDTDPMDIHYLTRDELTRMDNFPSDLKNRLASCGSRPQAEADQIRWAKCSHDVAVTKLVIGRDAYLGIYGSGSQH